MVENLKIEGHLGPMIKYIYFYLLILKLKCDFLIIIYCMKNMLNNLIIRLMV